jgi:hypothetical protein
MAELLVSKADVFTRCRLGTAGFGGESPIAVLR